MPVKAAGILTEPPISLPIPNLDPPAAIRLDSPPLEPPGVSLRFRKFFVSPNTGFAQPKLKIQRWFYNYYRFPYNV